MSELRIRVIGESERVWMELSIPDLHPDDRIDLEVTYPDGSTTRYEKEID